MDRSVSSSSMISLKAWTYSLRGTVNAKLPQLPTDDRPNSVFTRGTLLIVDDLPRESQGMDHLHDIPLLALSIVNASRLSLDSP